MVQKALHTTDIEYDVNELGYRLVRDRARRTIRPPERYGHADLTAYAFATTKQ